MADLGRFTPEGLAKSGTEHGEQAAFFAWCNRAMWLGVEAANDTDNWHKHRLGERVASGLRQIPALRWIHAIPNGGERGAASAGKMKAEGVKRGIADIFFPLPILPYHGLYIEMKRANGSPSDLSQDQEDFRDFVQPLGYAWQCCFGWKQARDVLCLYVTQGK